MQLIIEKMLEKTFVICYYRFIDDDLLKIVI